MKLHIERTPKKNNIKPKKTIHVGTHKKSVLFLWGLLIISIAFGIYKNFTAIDSHTIHETKITKPVVIDTHAIEAFTTNFIYDYYTWGNNKTSHMQRTKKINLYLTPELQELNINSVRFDIPTTSQVKKIQIWKIDAIDKQNYYVVYTVEQEIKEAEETKNSSSAFKIIVHQDKNQNLIITKNPTIWNAPKNSDYQPSKKENDLSINEKITKDITLFLETFFKLYPTATQNELNFYVENNSLPIINKNYLFSEIVNFSVKATGGTYHLDLSVKYIDNISKAEIASQYQLVLEKKNNWIIIGLFR